MADTADRVAGRISWTSTTALVAVGDLLAIGLFVLAGELQHFGVAFLVDHPARFAGTATPFLVGWIAGALVTGAYSTRARRDVRTAATDAAGTWSLAVILGQALRATAVFPGDFAVTFAIVSLGVGLALLVPWRVLCTRL